MRRSASRKPRIRRTANSAGLHTIVSVIVVPSFVPARFPSSMGLYFPFWWIMYRGMGAPAAASVPLIHGLPAAEGIGESELDLLLRRCDDGSRLCWGALALLAQLLFQLVEVGSNRRPQEGLPRSLPEGRGGDRAEDVRRRGETSNVETQAGAGW